MLRGKQLDEVIEHELQMMLVEGFEKFSYFAQSSSSTPNS